MKEVTKSKKQDGDIDKEEEGEECHGRLEGEQGDQRGEDEPALKKFD